MAGSNWQQLAGGSVNPYDIRRDDGTPTADYGEHIISDGGTVTLPSPKADKAVLVSNISQDTTVTTSTGLVEQQSDVTHLSSVSDPVLFVSDGSDWYVANNLDYVIAIPDSGNLQADWNPNAAFDGSFNNGDTITEDWSEPEGRTADATVNGDPTYRTNEVNGAPAVDLDDSGDYFTTALNPDTTEPRSVYAVMRWDTATGEQTAYGAFSTSPNNRFYGAYIRSGQIELGYGDTSALIGSVPSGYHIHSAIFGGGDAEAFDDDTSQGTITYGGVGTVSNSVAIGRRGGGANDADVSIVRILDYQADHGTSTRQDVWAYLNDEYSVF